ncbi:DNA replication protein-related [Zea mays]|uniref:DNA replication protein-related n=2 Tax=Zea mays TaxID=4577 RepID=A0A1D6FRS7_MAIZE|nr:DNA replication protein-related [Zea mays]
MDPDFELEFEMVGVLRAYKTTWDDGDSAAEAAATDVDLLKRAWLNEKAASDILSFDSPLALRVRDSGSDRGSLSWGRVTQEEALDDFIDDGVDDLVVSLYQMDLDRTLFLLRSYLLLEKIKKYTMHISRFDDLLSHLSQQERLVGAFITIVCATL